MNAAPIRAPGPWHRSPSGTPKLRNRTPEPELYDSAMAVVSDAIELLRARAARERALQRALSRGELAFSPALFPPSVL